MKKISLQNNGRRKFLKGVALAVAMPAIIGRASVSTAKAAFEGESLIAVSWSGNYEQVFRELVAALPLPAGTDRHALRLMLLGALNWARFWFDPQGRETPRGLAHKFVGLLREAQHAA